jgi:hypothetical protein
VKSMNEKVSLIARQDTSFTEAEHQLIAMKISYQAEGHMRVNKLMTEEDLEDVRDLMLVDYRRALGDERTQFVEGVDQHFDSDPIHLKVGPIPIEFQNGNHVNAITRGDPNNPDEIVITFPGTDFMDISDASKQRLANDSMIIVIKPSLTFARSKENTQMLKLLSMDTRWQGKMSSKSGWNSQIESVSTEMENEDKFTQEVTAQMYLMEVMLLSNEIYKEQACFPFI